MRYQKALGLEAHVASETELVIFQLVLCLSLPTLMFQVAVLLN